MRVRQAVLALGAGALVFASTATATPAQVTPKTGAVTGACTSAFMSADFASPGVLGTTVTFTASATGCATPEFKFYLQKPHGSWVAATAYGGATWVWNTTGLYGGIYGVGVWARAVGATAPYQAYWIGTYTLPLPSCKTAGISTAEYVEIPPGATDHIYGGACTGALFRFWLKRPGGSFRMVRDYSTDNVWTWNTKGYPLGTYLVGVWARVPGSPRAYDTYAIATFSIGSGGAGLQITPYEPQAPGTIVNLSAPSIKGFEYKFWLKAPGGPWIPKPYSTSASVDWDTIGDVNGTYQVGLWTRRIGTTRPYEGYTVMTYQLDVGQCSAVSLTSDVISPQIAGTTITFTAAANECFNPTYEFWLLPSPDHSWVDLQPYSATATYALDTTGAPDGPIRVGVWARQEGSTASFDTYAIVTFWIGS